MNFNEFPYARPVMDEVTKRFDDLLQKMMQALDVGTQQQAIQDINQLRTAFDTAREIASIRHTIDTTDSFYEKEQDFFDEVTPIYDGLLWKFHHALIESPFREQLEQQWGKQVFRLADMALKIHNPEIIEDLQKENRLVSEYTKLMASARILFEGEERNLSQLVPFQQSPDRTMRKKAAAARYGFLAEHEVELDHIYDKLVKVRTNIAHRLGFSTFTELAYLRMNRSDYDASMVASYREYVREHIVPIATRLRKRQQDRLGLDMLRYYDEGISFTTGNAKPKGDPTWILEQGKRMYQELSPETHEFFTFMTDHDLMDLVSKKGKAGGGYCTFIPQHGAPFIFSNFNGTSGDIDVLTHEAGHAFQVFTSRHFTLPEYHWPTNESCEIHSMSMEFLTWPWMHLFFENEEEKYKFSHLSESLLFIPYGVTVDEFQHFVYDHPEATPEERKQAWRDIERKYLPHRDYEDNTYLEHGGYWQQQAHIFSVPFYYIDYTLAQVCAFQFWIKAQQERSVAWQDYLRLCQAGGSQSFLELVKLADLKSPFDPSCIPSTMAPIEAFLDQVDDKSL